MTLRRALGAAVGAVGLAAAGNRLLTRRAGHLENPLPGDEDTYRWRGMDVAYTSAGDPDDPHLVLLHGIYAGASAYEFEPIFETLAEDYRVIAIDLPGFGRSDRPPLVYSPAFYEEFVRDVAADLAETPTVVASSLTGAFAARAAAADDTRAAAADDTRAAAADDTRAADDADVDRLVLICPTDETGARRPWLRSLLRAPVVGTALSNAIASKPAIRRFLSRDGYYDDANVDAAEVEYVWRSAHQPGARFAPASFVAGTLDPDADLEATLAAVDVPVTLVWGRDAELVPLREGRDLAERADLDLVVVDYATQLPHAEHPDRVAEYLAAELPRPGEEGR